MAPPQRRPRETSDGDGRDRCVKLRCSMDLDLLDCPICWEYLRAPIYQCKSGHAACEECYRQLAAKKCPLCTQPLGPERSTLLEKVAESVQSPCMHYGRGCKEMLPYDPRNRGTHEDECSFRSLRCPVPNCPNMYDTESVLMSEIASHMVLVHRAELVRYERPEQRTLPGRDDVIRNGFVVSTSKRDFDHTRSQYTIVLVGKGDDDPLAAAEPHDHPRIPLSPDHPDCRRFLIHHQVDDIKDLHTFSLTGFGTPNHRYRLTVLMQPEKYPANLDDGQPVHKFRLTCTKDGPVVDNQKPGFSLAKMVRHSDVVQMDKMRGAVYEVKFHITRA